MSEKFETLEWGGGGGLTKQEARQIHTLTKLYSHQNGRWVAHYFSKYLSVAFSVGFTEKKISCSHSSGVVSMESRFCFIKWKNLAVHWFLEHMHMSRGQE